MRWIGRLLHEVDRETHTFSCKQTGRRGALEGSARGGRAGGPRPHSSRMMYEVSPTTAMKAHKHMRKMPMLWAVRLDSGMQMMRG